MEIWRGRRWARGIGFRGTGLYDLYYHATNALGMAPYSHKVITGLVKVQQRLNFKDRFLQIQKYTGYSFYRRRQVKKEGIYFNQSYS